MIEEHMWNKRSRYQSSFEFLSKINQKQQPQFLCMLFEDTKGILNFLNIGFNLHQILYVNMFEYPSYDPW